MNILLLLIIVILVILVAFILYKLYPSKKTGSGPGSREECTNLYYYLPELNCFSDVLYTNFYEIAKKTPGLEMYTDKGAIEKLITKYTTTICKEVLKN